MQYDVMTIYAIPYRTIRHSTDLREVQCFDRRVISGTERGKIDQNIDSWILLHSITHALNNDDGYDVLCCQNNAPYRNRYFKIIIFGIYPVRHHTMP